MIRRNSRLVNKIWKPRLTLELLERRDVPSIAGPATFPAGIAPAEAAAGDFNGDGLPDIVIANATTPGRISLLLNTGDGTLSAPRSFLAGGNGTKSVAAGDINGDGRLDVVVANGISNTITLLRGTGAGLFRRPTPLQAGPNPSDVAVGDFNGDGILDIAVSNNQFAGQTGLSVLIGTGGGGFQAAQPYVIDTRGRAVAVGDLNGDGRDDVLVAGYSEGTSCGIKHAVTAVMLGQADGSLSANGSYGSQGPGDVSIGDFNGDGNLDFAVADNACSFKWIRVRIGNGDGTFQDSVGYGTGGSSPTSVAVADLNADGFDDLVATVHTRASIFLSNLSGSLQFVGSHIAGKETIRAIPMDVTRDGILDLPVVFGELQGGAVAVLKGLGGGAFDATPAYNSIPTSRGFVTGDLNHDSLPDLVLVNDPALPEIPGVHVLLNGGGAAFLPPASFPTTVGLDDVALADLNGDGHLDVIAAAFDAKKVIVLLGNGDGTFGTGTDVTLNGKTSAVATADFNDDGILDIAATYTGNLAILNGVGDGTFLPETLYPATGCIGDVDVGDFDADSFADIVVADCSTHLSVFLNRGDGAFKLKTDYAVSSPGVVKVADVTGDSILDLVSGGNAGMVVFSGRGDGTFEPGVTYAIGKQEDIQVGEFNNDGLADIAGIQYCCTATVLLNAGGGTFEASRYVGGAYPDHLIIADLDADGWSDIAVDNRTNVNGQPNVTILRNATDWPPLPIVNVGDRVVMAVNAFDEPLKTIPVALTAEAGRPIHPLLQQNAPSKPHPEPTNRVIRALAKHSDTLAVDITTNWNY